MHYLTEDPSYLLIGLGLAVLGCLLALKISQQGKFLLWAGALAAVAAVIFGVEHFWVTEAEQVERVVYDLAEAGEASDVDRIKSHLDDKVTIGMRERTVDGSIPMKLVFGLLKETRFDFVRVAQLTTSVGSQTRMGKAEFKVSATGVFNEGGSDLPLGSLGTEWSLSFREASPGVWKVTKLQAIKVPPQVSRYLFGR